jgi:hypothetical protein
MADFKNTSGVCLDSVFTPKNNVHITLSLTQLQVADHMLNRETQVSMLHLQKKKQASCVTASNSPLA